MRWWWLSVLGLAGCQMGASALENGATRSQVLDKNAVVQQEQVAQVADVEGTAEEKFAQWKLGFAQRAVAQGLAQPLVDKLLALAVFQAPVVAKDKSQPEFSKMVWQYLDGVVSSVRIRHGRQALAREAALLAQLEARFGVEKEVLVAIWGLETAYGTNTGKVDLISALATLAAEGRRTAFAEQQLLALLRLLSAEEIEWTQLKGSWAGGMGQTQFIPTTYEQYAQDGDGDGRRNLWQTADALASAANYLRASGWRQGMTWGYAVTLPKSFDVQWIDEKKPLQEWWRLGVVSLMGNKGSEENWSARLWLPAGIEGVAFLLSENFSVFRAYNQSSNYALAVGLLADALSGREYALEWPRHQRGLLPEERLRLQQRLNGLGFAVGAEDGVLGSKTRQAFRAWQQATGKVADGFISAETAKELLAP